MLYRLVSGTPSNVKSDLGDVINSLRYRMLQIEVAERQLRRLAVNKNDMALYGPYLARAYLETACTTLLARLDPFRVLVAKKHQDSADYEPLQRSKTAIQWTGDIISRTKPPHEGLWSINPADPGYRALLGQWWEQLVWAPAFEKFNDTVAGKAHVHDWLYDLSTKPVSGFCREISSALDGLFSRLSKGVHSELLGDQHKMFDPVSVESDFQAVAHRVTCLAVLSHFSEQFCYRIDPSKAIQIANRIGKVWK